MLRVAFLTVPQFAIQLELQRRGISRPGNQPIILVTPPEDGGRVFARSPEAGRRGVSIGLPLRLALTRCNEAVFWTADVAWYESRFEALLDALEAVSPVVSPDTGTLGCVWIGLRGLDRLYGDETAVAAAIVECCQNTLGLRPRVGVANGKFQARLAALAGRTRGEQSPGQEGVRILGDDERDRFLGGFGIEVLPLSLEHRRRLKLLGIHTVSQLAGLRRADVQVQCGNEGARAWDLAHGMDDDRLIPRRPRKAIRESARFPVATASLDLVQAAVRHILARLLRRPEVRDRFIRRLTLRAQLTSGTTWERTIVFREPLQEQEDLQWQITSRLAALELPGAMDEFEIELGELCGEPSRQPRLLLEHKGAEEHLLGTIRQLNTRVGEPLVTRVVEVEPWSRIPERRYALIEYASSRAPSHPRRSSSTASRRP